MDEFKILTQGVSFKRTGQLAVSPYIKKEKDNDQKENENTKFLSRLNFFGEQKEEIQPEGESVGSKWSSGKVTQQNNDDNETSSSDDWFYSDEMVSRYRKKHKIYVYSYGDTKNKCPTDCSTIPMPIKTFGQLNNYFNVEPWIIQHVKTHLRLKKPTPIQQQSIPCLLSGQNVLASAPTGSGKTLAFLLPLLILLKVHEVPKKEFLRSLILVPSRELAVQIIHECIILCGNQRFRCRILGRRAVYHSTSTLPQRLDLGVSTPLRLVQMLKEGQVTFKYLKHIVLDEADRLLDMGFAPQLDEILSFVNLESTQLAFFSATMTSEVSRLVNSFAFNVLRISIGTPMSSPSEIRHQLVFVTQEEGKLFSFRQFVHQNLIKPPALVFIETIERATQLFTELVYDGIFVDVMHSGRTNSERDAIITAFREKKIWVLICTDVMARGLDFKGIRTVVNWDLPKTASLYIHRVGRTGRAGLEGMAITFFTLDDMYKLRPIVNVIRESGGDVPDWMLKIKKRKDRFLPYKKIKKNK